MMGQGHPSANHYFILNFEVFVSMGEYSMIVCTLGSAYVGGDVSHVTSRDYVKQAVIM